MALALKKCPFCGSTHVIRNGKDESGKQRYKCKNKDCPHKTFVDEYDKKGCDPKIKEQILKMTVNGNGTRAIARTLEISTNTVTSELKKRNLARTSKHELHRIPQKITY